MQNTMTNEELQDAITEANHALGDTKPETPDRNIWRAHLEALLDIQRVRAITVHEDGIDSAAPEPAQDGQAENIHRMTEALGEIARSTAAEMDGQADKIGRLMRALEEIALNNYDGKWCSDVATSALEAVKEARHDGA